MAESDTFASDNNDGFAPQPSSSAIDSALLAAVRDPRERVALLRLEQVMVDFCKSDAGWLEVGGPYNSVICSPVQTVQRPPAHQGRQTSFQRCILHRLADRFGIVRENGSLMEASIRLIKVPDSRIPEQLLQDLDLTKFSAVDGDETNGNNKTSPITKTSSNSSLTDANKPPRKMKIMKRASERSGQSNNAKSSASRKSATSLSDKERAYAEARARIFKTDESLSTPAAEDTSSACQESSAGFPSATSSPSLSTLASSSATSPVSDGQQQSGNTSDDRPKDDNNESANVTSSLPASVPDAYSPQSSFATDLATATNNLAAATLKGSKAVYRNRAEEAADPDFRRGSGAVVFHQPPPANAVPYYGTATYSGAVYPQQPQQQQHATQAAAAYYNNMPYYPQQPKVPISSSGTSPGLNTQAPAFYPPTAAASIPCVQSQDSYERAGGGNGGPYHGSSMVGRGDLVTAVSSGSTAGVENPYQKS